MRLPTRQEVTEFNDRVCIAAYKTKEALKQAPKLARGIGAVIKYEWTRGR